MELNRDAIDRLQQIADEGRQQQLQELRASRPEDKEPFNMAEFLVLSFGEKFGRTDTQLEITYYQAFKDLRTMAEFVTAMTNYTY